MLVAMIPEPMPRKDGYRNPPLDCDINDFEGWYTSFRREPRAEVVPGFPFKELTAKGVKYIGTPPEPS